MPRRIDPWDLPYGIYLAHDSAVLFDRRYEPIVRFLPGDIVVPCDPTEWVHHYARLYHYNDATTPTYNSTTRSRLRALVGSIPELAAEISRRAHIRKSPRF
jgi:hypothetical protein